jgi:hypothetical protein
MLSRCANPECKAPFRYFGEGRLFAFENNHEGTETAETSRSVRKVEHYWLCPSCSAGMTLNLDGQGKVAVVSTQRRAGGSAAG